MVRKVLENLLASASLPDAHSSAELLLSRYHTLDGVFCADASDLTDLVGERGAMIIKLTAATVCRRAEDKLVPGTRYDEVKMREHLIGFFCGSAIELLYLISLGESDEILSVDLIGEGTVNSAGVTSRRLLDAAVKNRAKSVIIAHNHPAGRATPSAEDMAFTDAAEKLLFEIGIRLRAHYIVAGNQCRRID